MSAPKSTNPLGAAQPNKAGAQTFAKYEYQYHWALCKIIDRHLEEKDYVIFVEFHEDVLYSTSSIETEALFEFTQVKNFAGSPWSQKTITKISKEKKRSILGRMLEGIKEKPFENKIISLELAGSAGFNLPQKNKELKLDIIKLEDIDDACISFIKNAIENEIGLTSLPSNLVFVKPNLAPGSVRAEAIAKISDLITKKNPKLFHNPTNIYRALIDDLHIKGQIDYDFTDWERLIKSKGTTHEEVSQVIKNYTNENTLEDLKPHLTDFFNDLKLPSHKKTIIRQSFIRYHNATKLNRDAAALEKQKIIAAIANSNFLIYLEDGLEKFLEACTPTLTSQDFYQSIDDKIITAELLYELSLKCHEE